MEQFSGIPVKELLQNDEKTTALDLSESGCGHTEALVLAECLKVVDLFIFLGVFRVSLVTAVPVTRAVRNVLGMLLWTGQRDVDAG